MRVLGKPQGYLQCLGRRYDDAVSVPVPLSELAAAMGEYGFAYLMTVGQDLRVHAVAVRPRVDGARLLVENPGRRSAANAKERPGLSLVWPPPDAGGYSLIVDGDAEVADGLLRVAPTRAVKHRPAPEGFDAPAEGCGSDCQPVRLTG